MSDVVKVQGLRELRKALKAAGDEMPKELRKTNKAVVERIIVPEAKRRGNASRTNLAGGTARLGSKGVATIKAQASQRSAAVTMGGARAPWAGGSEWGSGGRYRQFPARSEGGYILYPTVKEKRPEIVEAYTDALEELTGRVFR